MVPALQRLGHDVWPLPTVLLSNHPGHAYAAGVRIAPADLERMLDALGRNGWIGAVDAVIAGYLPSAEHVGVAARTIRRLKSERPVRFLCDPVLGDEPKGLYIDAAAAHALRQELLPLADVLTPNRFELGWLTGQPVNALDEVRCAAACLQTEMVVVTSAALRDGNLIALLSAPPVVGLCETAWIENVPHGTGDLFAALLLGHLLNGEPRQDAVGRAVAGVAATIERSAGRGELALVASLDACAAAAPDEVLWTEWT